MSDGPVFLRSLRLCESSFSQMFMAWYISRKAAKVARTIFTCESPCSQMFMAWYTSRQAAKVAKIICNTKQLGGPVCCTQNGHPII